MPGRSLKEQIVERSAMAGGRLRVRSALNPALWLCGIVTVPCAVLATYSDDPPTWLVAIACGPLVLASIGFLVLLFFDRDKLQSEDYQIRARMLELLQAEKGGLPDSTTRVLGDIIPNPEGRRLSQPSEDDHD